VSARLRAPTAAVAVAALAAVVALPAGCRGRWLLGPFQRRAAAEEPLAWAPLPAATAVDVFESGHGSVRFRVPLSATPPGDGTAAGAVAGALRRVEVRFHDPLDGAAVDAVAVGAPGWLTVVDGKRIGGDTVSVPIPPGDLDRVELTVHHHLRPLPVVREVRLGRLAAIASPAPGPP
jgi:hypothetical protein